MDEDHTARPAVSDAYDVIVIGLGAMGSAALCHATLSGARALGIDRFHPPHEFGSTHGETRITRQAIGEGQQFVPLVLRANKLWRELEAATGETLLVQNGGLILLEDSAEQGSGATFFQRTIATAKQFSIPHELLSALEIRHRFPQFIVADSSAAYYEPGAGFLYPEKCVAAHLTLATQRGAVIRCGETVTKIEATADSVIVHTDKGSYAAASTILAAGPWMPRWAQQICGLPESSFQVYQQMLHWFQLSPPSADFSAQKMPIFIHTSAEEKASIYGFPSLDGQTIKVATETFHAATEPDATPYALTPEQEQRFYAELVLPRLRGVSSELVKTKTCFYTQTPDQSFVIDHAPHSERLWFASACSGHGFKHSATVGETLAHKALGLQTKVDLAPFARSRRL